MCGLNLIYDTQGALPGPEPLERMQAAITHRGPDSAGTERIPWQQGQVWLGNRRLRVLDTRQLADQPWHYPRNNAHSWLSYNGELYNYIDLRNELLQRGYEFNSGSDTEVVLYALDAWGEEALSRFQGMFALVYLNTQRQELLLARDRHGMKPLYWCQTTNYLLASSEIRGILASRIVKPQLKPQQITHYLQHRYAQAPATFFQKINSLEAGTYRKLEAGRLGPARPIQPISARSSYPAYSRENLEELLVDSLYRHVQANRPLGLFLSGGTDSSLLLALTRKHLAQHMPICYTATNPEAEASWGTQDFKWAQRVARQYDAIHQPIPISSEEVLGRFSEIARSQDQPIADGAYWLTYLLSEQAAPHSPVVLSGAGADEHFAGYYRLAAYQYYLKHRSRLKPLLPLGRVIAGVLPTGYRWPGRAKAQQLHKLLSRLQPAASATWQRFSSLATALSAEATLPTGDFSLQAAYRHDIEHYLRHNVLALSDRASMQHGLELRMPYLDDELLAWLGQFEAEELLSKGRKWMLQDLLQQQPGGKAVSKRRKEGFGLPFGLWVKQGKTEALWSWLQEQDSELHAYLPTQRIENLLKQHRAGRADYSQELLAVAGLAEWLKGHKNY